ncbi:hypothetical protein C4K18_3056 [Pseudomonas chlororaphis subsp. aurantiaca]|nr:hypothetical protein C4K18_3056 [Pseudomonas chlororaphis subsp. aurantiaca]
MFISKLKALGAPLDAWPFNTKYQGLRTISSYMKHLLEDNFGSSVTARGSSEAKAHLQVGRGKHTLIDAQDPYDVVEMDSYYLDCRMSVFFATPQGTQVSVLINRIWLVAMIDRASKAIISYKLIYRSEVSAADVIEVLRLALSPTHIRPPAVVEGIKYPTGGGLPLEVIPECRHALWSVLMLDNALAHLSSKISESARKEVAFALNYGPVGYPMRRPNIEHSFKEFAKNLFWRLITTTGSNPQNGRAEDAEDAAMIYKVEAAHIEHLLDVEIAQYNCRPSEGLFFYHR